MDSQTQGLLQRTLRYWINELIEQTETILPKETRHEHVVKLDQVVPDESLPAKLKRLLDSKYKVLFVVALDRHLMAQKKKWNDEHFIQNLNRTLVWKQVCPCKHEGDLQASMISVLSRCVKHWITLSTPSTMGLKSEHAK
jgi:hypothetical protein